VAYHFHWPADQITSLEHADRRRWIAHISQLNQRVNEASGHG
jgi:hypothetical protein